ncbi:MAG: lamin tail domain-containing protein [Chloroflexota bacterium]
MLGLLFGLLCISQSEAHAQAPNVAPLAESETLFLYINEIHYDPANKTAQTEFIELYNPNPFPLDVSQWGVEDAVRYVITETTIIEPEGYLIFAQNPDALRTQFVIPETVPVQGPYIGRLSPRGEKITIRNEQAKVVDIVKYDLGFPWPIVGDNQDNSIGLVSPIVDNNHPGSWRSAPPSPGLPNVQLVVNPPPLVNHVQHTPLAPTSTQTVTISAEIEDRDGVTTVELDYQLVDAGRYIRLNDTEYETQWFTIPMTDTAGEGFYTAQISPELGGHRRLIRYRIRATDSLSNTITLPYPDDPQPNFAYFIHDGVADWSAAANPDDAGLLGDYITYSFDDMEAVTVYHFMADGDDIDAAMFNSPRGLGYMGNDEQWLGTLIVDGQVYDHVGFRARGGYWRYAMGKNMWKFNFHRGHRLQASSNTGTSYETEWDKLNLSAIIQQGYFQHRGEQGLFESVGFRLFELAGVEAPKTHYVHLRVLDDDAETTGSQYEGDFWGLYLAVEQIDGRFLDEHALPDGNLYKMENWTGALRNQGPNDATNKSDLNTFLDTYNDSNSPPTEQWWRENLDLQRYYSYRAIVDGIHHYDISDGRNYFYYRDPDTHLWSVVPWDLDLSWSDTTFGQGKEPFQSRVLSQPIFQLEFQNRLRELRDLLYNPEQVGLLIDEIAAVVDHPAITTSIVNADRAMWDHNPIMTSDYVRLDRAGAGRYYELSPSGDFAGMAQLMKNFVAARSAWIDSELLTDTDMPDTPTVTFIGPPDYPADQLQFQASPFSDPQGNHTFQAMQWRVAEITDPSSPDYELTDPNFYEINARWQSDPLTIYSDTIKLPTASCRPLQTCRVRVRMQDDTGRWSHWSASVQFIASAPMHPPTDALVITELMYHPPDVGPVEGSTFEFVELHNSSNEPIDLSGVHFSDGIAYTFTVGTVLPAGGYVLLAQDADQFQEYYGFAADGEYNKRFSNAGERVALTDAYSRTLFSFTYDDVSPWPTAADGEGHSLVLADIPINRAVVQAVDPNDPTSWQPSLHMGGSPSGDDATYCIAEAAPDLTIHMNAEIDAQNTLTRVVQLMWPNSEAGRAGNTTYEVWRTINSPYFTPGDVGAELLETISSKQSMTPYLYQIQDVGIGNPDIHYFYRVRTIRRCGSEQFHADSYTVGEIDYPLMTTGSTDFSWVGLPFHMDDIQTSADLVAHIEANSNVTLTVNAIDHWNATSQSYDSYIPSLSLGNVPITVGGVYRVSVEFTTEALGTAIWSLVGRVPDPALFAAQLNRLQTTGSTDFNWLLWPFDADVSPAERMYGHVQIASGVNVIDYFSMHNVQHEIAAIDVWNRASQSYDTYLPELPFLGDVQVRIGHPYRVSLLDE